MKKLIFILMVVSLSVGWAQKDNKNNHRRFNKKFEELEKIKLLETLNLDEETTLKFFARRNESKNKIVSLYEESVNNYDELEAILSDDNGYSNFDNLINRKLEIESQIINEKAKFLKSLENILTKKQILKFVLFERKFKKNVRDLLIEKGRKRFKKENLDK